jgi:chemotaxis-related protein WspB
VLFLLCQAGGHRFGLDLSDVIAVLPRARLQPAAGAPPWLAGLFAHEGRPTPVLDLPLLVAGKPCPLVWSSRIVLVSVPSPSGPQRLGLLMEHVETAQRSEQPGDGLASAPGLPDWGPAFLHEGGLVQFLELPRLLPVCQPQPLLTLTELTEGA